MDYMEGPTALKKNVVLSPKRYKSSKARLHRRLLSLNANFSEAEVASTQFRNCAATKSQVVYTLDIQVATKSATKIALSFATKIACVNGPLGYYQTILFVVLNYLGLSRA